LHAEQSNPRKLVWVDIGGGTGWNIERMDRYLSVEQFHRVFLVDITPSLCEVARERFDRLGWSNVRVLCMDALDFDLKQLEGKEEAEDMEVVLITLSYARRLIHF
jgi:betaine lipid synthase